MGAWGVGPFDNDTAADWCGDLDDQPARKRAHAVRQALASAANETDYLDADLAQEAVAAGALVAGYCPGGEKLASAYGPKEPLPLEADLPALRALAIQAIDRIVADDSELAELWDESDDPSWREGLQVLRGILAS